MCRERVVDQGEEKRQRFRVVQQISRNSKNIAFQFAIHTIRHKLWQHKKWINLKAKLDILLHLMSFAGVAVSHARAAGWYAIPCRSRSHKNRDVNKTARNAKTKSSKEPQNSSSTVPRLAAASCIPLPERCWLMVVGWYAWRSPSSPPYLSSRSLSQHSFQYGSWRMTFSGPFLPRPNPPKPRRTQIRWKTRERNSTRVLLHINWWHLWFIYSWNLCSFISSKTIFIVH